MITIRNLRLFLAVLILVGAVAVNAVSRLWRFPAENLFLIIFISIPFVLFLAPTFLAKRSFAHFSTAGFVIAATCLGIVEYYGQTHGPEIPTMYFGVPVVQAIFALLSLAVAAIDFFVSRRHERQNA